MHVSALQPPSLAERASWVVGESLPEATLEVPVGTKTTYLTHGLFRYAGKLPPPLVAYLLDKYTEPGDVVVDPMCGGGSTAIEAVSSGRESINFDINPVSRIVTSAVSSIADVRGLLEFVEEVLAWTKRVKPPSELACYFTPATYGLLRGGLDLARGDVERALVLSIARASSFANTKKINTVVDPAKTPRAASDLIVKTAERFASGLTELEAAEPCRPAIEEASAATIPLPDDSADLILLHPPYLTNTAFSESMHLQLLLIGADPADVRKSELAYRGSYFHVPNGLHKYLLGWAKILAEATRITRPEGHVAVVVGDGRIDKVRIPVGTITQEFAVDLGLRLVERAMHVLNNQTGWTLSRRMKGQHVLVFRV
jgi:hypothetical protein